MGDPRKRGPQTYEFSGIATVSVVAYIEADSAEEARTLLDRGEGEWVCEQVDGDVQDIELSGNPDEDEDEEQGEDPKR